MPPIFDTLAAILVEQFEVEPEAVSPDSTFADLGIDSLFLAEFLTVVETEYSIKITDETFSPRDTLRRLALALADDVAPAGSPK